MEAKRKSSEKPVGEPEKRSRKELSNSPATSDLFDGASLDRLDEEEPFEGFSSPATSDLFDQATSEASVEALSPNTSDLFEPQCSVMSEEKGCGSLTFLASDCKREALQITDDMGCAPLTVSDDEDENLSSTSKSDAAFSETYLTSPV